MSQARLESVAGIICKENGYDLVKKVGVGAFKETFHVLLGDGTSMALKVFQQVNSPERTQREIEAMTRCDHPNIGKLSSVDTFQVGEKNYLFSLEEYLAGGTLTQRVEDETLDIEEANSIGESLISAVAHIASHELVHRDLKPDNIMFQEDKVTPMIVDFGLVRDLSGTSLTKTWVPIGPGTPYYAAPEQLTNNKELIDWRTDQFALGVLLTECTFGYHPYSDSGDDMSQILERVAQRNGPTKRLEADAVDNDLTALVRMVASWPVARYRTPHELAYAWNNQRIGT